MNWIVLALLAPLVYAVNVFIDKYLVGSRLPNYRSLPIFTSILAFPIAVGILLYSGFGGVGWFDACLVAVTGVFTIWAFSLYLEALIQEETSLIIILLQFVPVIVFGLSYLFLGEDITLKQLLGFVLLFIASILASVKSQKSKPKLSKALGFILLADFLWAIPYVLIKFASPAVDFTSVIMYESFGVVIGGLALWFFIPSIRNAFLITKSKITAADFGVIMGNEGLFFGGKILTYLAVVIGPPTLVSILGSTQIFFGILFGLLTAMIMPKVFKEDITKEGLVKKVILGVVALVGIILIS